MKLTNKLSKLPVISVIIINYNTFELTCKCIQSVYDKTENIYYEIILVDNASVECNADLFKQKFPLITVIKSNTNLGFAGGNNLGLKYTNGEYILLLNSDTELLNNAIDIVYNKMKEEKVLVAGCKTFNYDGSLQNTTEMFPSIKGSIYRIFNLNKIFNIVGLNKIQLKYNHQDDFYPDWIWASFFFFKVEVLQLFAEQKLPDEFFMYGEDMLWCYLLKKKQVLVKYYTEAHIKHYFSGDKKYKGFDNNPGFKNGTLFMKRYYSSGTYLMIILLDMVFDITRLRWTDLFKKIKYYLPE
ncbi:MAG TPA: glycosyltransferase family 2 protein [Ferruginibacter sp.]|nr:glycosyltransferase family 2 protein [Ferruginibacter sp.]